MHVFCFLNKQTNDTTNEGEIRLVDTGSLTGEEWVYGFLFSIIWEEVTRPKCCQPALDDLCLEIGTQSPKPVTRRLSYLRHGQSICSLGAILCKFHL